MIDLQLTYKPITEARFVSTQAFEGLRGHLANFKASKLQPSYDWLCTKIAAVLQSLPPQPVIDWDLAYIPKWGPQGHSVDYEALEGRVAEYYENVGAYDNWSFERSWQWEKVAAATYPDLAPMASVYAGDHKSNSGLDSWSDRRDPQVQADAMRRAAAQPDRFDAQVLGQKCEKNAARTIFMDSFSNYFRTAIVWQPLHDAMARRPEIAWGKDLFFWNEVKLNGFFTRHPDGVVAIKGDAKHMDTYMDDVICSRILYDVNGTQAWREKAFFQSQLWHTELITPKGVIPAMAHTLFSGLVPTNDLESYHSFDTTYDLINHLPWKHGIVPMYGVHFVFLVLGDDMVLLVGRKYLRDVPDQQFVADIWVKHGMYAHPEKQGCEVADHVAFCKRFYTPALSRSVYSLVLAANAFVHPRGGGALDERDPLTTIRFCQLFDDCIGHPAWNHVMQLMLKEFPWLMTTAVTAADELRYNAEARNWRMRTFGEMFACATSLTWQWIQQYRDGLTPAAPKRVSGSGWMETHKALTPAIIKMAEI